MRQSQILFFVLILATVSCGKKEARSGDNNLATSKQELVETGNDTETTNSIIVPMKLISSAFKIDNETDSVITIEPCTPYYKEWISNKRIKLDDYYMKGDVLDCPKIDIYIVNNTNQTLNISSLDFLVQESKTDNIPYLYIYDNYASHSNSMFIENQSWFDWGSLHIDYSIMKRGESFNGTYKKRRTIPYFEDDCIVDFTQDLVDMGFDLESFYDKTPEDHLNFLNINEFSSDEMLKIFYPFEVSDYGAGFARIYGKISFSKSKFTKEFFGNIYINPGTEGAGEPDADQFDVNLKYNKRNYMISYPYTTTLKPGDNEKVKLKLNCPRSSNHRFYISINNDNGLVMRTKDIQMHFINGRSSNLNSHD